MRAAVLRKGVLRIRTQLTGRHRSGKAVHRLVRKRIRADDTLGGADVQEHAIGVRSSRTPRGERGGAAAHPAGRIIEQVAKEKGRRLQPFDAPVQIRPCSPGFWFRSSTAEHSVVNREVVGSSPIGTAILEWRNLAATTFSETVAPRGA